MAAIITTAGAALSRGGGLQLLLALFFLLLAGASHGAVLGVQTGTATWSGPPKSARYDNLSMCAFGEAVLNPPFGLFVTGFGNASECGVCYKVACKGHPACSELPVVVTVTDVCRGPPVLCRPDPSRGLSLSHFDMGGFAFGTMAFPGREDELRAVGPVAVTFEWTDCNYSRPNASVVYPAFQAYGNTTRKSPTDLFLLRLIYVEGLSFWPGVKVSLKNAGDTEWRQMEHSRASEWAFKYNQTFPSVTPPLSIRVETKYMAPKEELHTVIAKDVIPVGFEPGKFYYGTA